MEVYIFHKLLWWEIVSWLFWNHYMYQWPSSEILKAESSKTEVVAIHSGTSADTLFHWVNSMIIFQYYCVFVRCIFIFSWSSSEIVQGLDMCHQQQLHKLQMFAKESLLIHMFLPWCWARRCFYWCVRTSNHLSNALLI